MEPQQGILFIINVVLHMICIIPVTSQNHIHHSTLSGEHSYSTNRGECCEQTNMKTFSPNQGFRGWEEMLEEVKDDCYEKRKQIFSYFRVMKDLLSF
jgi:hypothetical protein